VRQPPLDAFSDFGGLDVSVSTTQLQALTEALVYLYHYIYECCEQMASRLIGVLALRDLLVAFKSNALPAFDVIQTKLTRDIKLLASRQREDGGWGYDMRCCRCLALTP
jgi:uncharacterized protein YfaS (alpha-2-macroglobulin family)